MSMIHCYIEAKKGQAKKAQHTHLVRFHSCISSYPTLEGSQNVSSAYL